VIWSAVAAGTVSFVLFSDPQNISFLVHFFRDPIFESSMLEEGSMNSRINTRRTGSKSFSNVLGRLQIQYLAVDQLKLDPKNPRLHSRKQVRQVAESIKAFAFNVPVLIDARNRVIAGHGRLDACKLLGIREVPPSVCKA
jgi:hypothetical protein